MDGLSSAQARARLALDGPNRLPETRPRGVLRLVWQIVSEPMFLLLIACGATYMVLGDRHEALMLLGFVFVVMAMTFIQQRRAERSLTALRVLSSPQARVLRDGVAVSIDAAGLVCGDVVLLAEGNRIPADMMLLAAAGFSVDESMLTGESVPVCKSATSVSAGQDEGRVFSGTLVTQGTASARVTATGRHSTLGRIGHSLAALGDDQTAVQRETRMVVVRVALAGMALAVALALTYGYLRGDWLYGLLAGLTLAMAVLPEELPVILTLFLGLGAWRLAREHVLARHIPAIELLGAATVLCVDKTGTLTENRMVVRTICSDTVTDDHLAQPDAVLDAALHDVLAFAVLACHRQAFDPMEMAIRHCGLRLLANTAHLYQDWMLVEDYPLSNEMMAMSRVWRSPDHRQLLVAAKGAPEAIVDLCHLVPQRAASIAVQADAMAQQGLRVIGVARARVGVGRLPDCQHAFDFEFVGLLALEDPVRPDVPHAIAECRAAGIRVVMMTGDHPATAQAIAAQAGLDVSGRVMTGTQLSALSDAGLQLQLADTVVFCRVQPEQKLRLVQAFRQHGDVVAMTGDGVNDAPALKAAHIGVAMGASGTDVAREAAALVLLNDDFASLVTAVRHGRRVFANLRKAIVFVVAVHVPIVGLSMLPVLLGWPMLLLPVHILFLQLVIDPACSVVFESAPAEPDSMMRPPRRPDARLFDLAVLTSGVCQGGGLLAVLLAAYALARFASGSDDMARAMTFMVLVLSSLGLIYINRSRTGRLVTGDGMANRTLAWVAVTTLLLLACILWIAPVSRLFAFVTPPPFMLVAGVGLSGISLLWFRFVTWLGARAEAPPAHSIP